MCISFFTLALRHTTNKLQPFLRENSRSKRGPAAPPDHFVTQLLKDCKCREHLMGNEDVLTALTLYRNTGDTQHRDTIIRGNMLLIVWCAQNFYKSNPDARLCDLVQEGVIGFIRGLDNFKFEFKGNGPVCNYALNYSKATMQVYLDEKLAAVKVGRRAMGAAKKGMKLLEAAVKEFESNAITLDWVLSERPPSERIGALDAFGTVESMDGPVDEREHMVESRGNGGEGWNVRNATTQRWSPADHCQSERHGGGPQFGPQGNPEYEKLASMCRILNEQQRKLVFCFYGLEPRGPGFPELCDQLGISVESGNAQVRQTVQYLRRTYAPPPAAAPGDAPPAPGGPH